MIRKKALEMVAANGFEGLSMQKLARAANVSPATIYIYFKDRDDLIYQLCKEEGEKMIAATFRDFDPEMNFAEGLRIQWRNRLRYSVENPMSGRFLDQIRHTPPYEAYFNGSGVFPKVMGAFIKNAIARGEVVALPKEVYWSIAFAPLYQLIKFHMTGKGLPGTEVFVFDDNKFELALGLVLKALTP